MYSIGIQSLSENGEPKYFAFRRWLDIIILWQADWIPTPWKINMEPTNHPFRKENDLPNLHDYVPC